MIIDYRLHTTTVRTAPSIQGWSCDEGARLQQSGGENSLKHGVLLNCESSRPSPVTTTLPSSCNQTQIKENQLPCLVLLPQTCPAVCNLVLSQIPPYRVFHYPLPLECCPRPVTCFNCLLSKVCGENTRRVKIYLKAKRLLGNNWPTPMDVKSKEPPLALLLATFHSHPFLKSLGKRWHDPPWRGEGYNVTLQPFYFTEYLAGWLN